ncbi:proteoglycan 4-like [Neocloeon triangulifer]|uniref:proteoglycan 4-like n=1 Tax=Neocloeon triangulifer TaxID=2078957 RepID=UPI00286F8215|nr:proteoglycan 4-like [Neocloeon triangulifer]
MSDSNHTMSGLNSASEMTSIKTDVLRNRVSQPIPDTYTSPVPSSQRPASQSQYQTPSANQYQPPTTTTPSYQPSSATANYQPLSSSQYQTSATTREPPLTSQYQPATGPTTAYQPPATPYQPPTTPYQSLSSQNQPAAQFQTPSTQYQTPPSQNQTYQAAPTTQYQPPPAQYQPPATPYQPPPSQQPPPQQERPERVISGVTRTPSVRQLQTPVDPAPSPVLPSGKPVTKEVTITLSGKLPSVPAAPLEVSKPIVDAAKEGEELLNRQVPRQPQPQDYREPPQQRQFERPAVQPQQVIQQPPREPLPATPVPQKPRPTDLTLQQERPSSRAAPSRTPAGGSWCPKTGRFIPDPPDPRAEIIQRQPPPEVMTPTPRKPKGMYCPRTGRYIPAQGDVQRRAMTPRGDEFRVKFAEIESETPRYAKKEKKVAKPPMAFGSVISTPRDPARVRRAKSTEGIAQRNAMTPRGDGRDFARSIENYEAEEEKQGNLVRSASTRSSLRRPKPETPTRSNDYSNVTPRVSTFNDHYQPTGGVKKVVGSKLQWNAKSRVDCYRRPEEKKVQPPTEHRNPASNDYRPETREYQTRHVESTQNYHPEVQHAYQSEEDSKRLPRGRIK